MTDEIWQPVVGFEIAYEVSILGRVRTIARRDTLGRNILARIRKLSVNVLSGYVYVNLQLDGLIQLKAVHIAVLEAFVGNRPNGMQACHLNGIQSDNRLENLRWGSPQSNYTDRARHGRVARGEHHYAAKLNEVDVERIRDMVTAGCRQKMLALQFGISRSAVCLIANGKNWAKPVLWNRPNG